MDLRLRCCGQCGFGIFQGGSFSELGMRKLGRNRAPRSPGDDRQSGCLVSRCLWVDLGFSSLENRFPIPISNGGACILLLVFPWFLTQVAAGRLLATIRGS